MSEALACRLFGHKFRFGSGLRVSYYETSLRRYRKCVRCGAPTRAAREGR